MFSIVQKIIYGSLFGRTAVKSLTTQTAANEVVRANYSNESHLGMLILCIVGGAIGVAILGWIFDPSCARQQKQAEVKKRKKKKKVKTS